MNLLSIDYGSKRIGLAVSIKGVISPLKTTPNDKTLIPLIKTMASQYRVSRIYVGLSEGSFADTTKIFITKLKNSTKIPVIAVEEAVSTIEADRIFKNNRNKRKNYKKQIDSIAAAVILSRVQV